VDFTSIKSGSEMPCLPYHRSPVRAGAGGEEGEWRYVFYGGVVGRGICVDVCAEEEKRRKGYYSWVRNAPNCAFRKKVIQE
jgi:hypothetical protein